MDFMLFRFLEENRIIQKIAIVDETIQVSKVTQNEFYDSVALAFYYKADSTSFNNAADELGFEVNHQDMSH